MGRLTLKRRRFALEYLVDGNGGAAAFRAGFSKKGCRARASKLLQDPDIKALIERETEKVLRQTRITAERVLEELAEIAYINPGDFIDFSAAGGPVIDLSMLPKGATKAISEIQQETVFIKQGKGRTPKEVRRTKVKMHDKRAALVDLGRHLKLFTDKTELSADGDLANLLRAVDGKSRGLPNGGGAVRGSAVAPQQPVSHPDEGGAEGALPDELGPGTTIQ